MGNYLRIYKDLDEFKSNAFNLPYPCVSVVDDDTIETDEEIVEFEQLDKLSFKVEVPLENASTECVNVASFSNPISVEGYSINGGDAVFIDLPQLIDTTQEIVWVYQNINGSDMYAPSYDNHMLISDLNSDLKIKTNRPINENDFLFMSLGLGGQVAIAQPLPMTELNGELIMEEPAVYKLHSGFLAELKNKFASFPEGVVICLSFVDNGYVIGSGQTKPSITTSVGALKYETELKETKVEFVLTEVSGSSRYLPSDNYLFDVFSINNDTRIKISRALVGTDYVMMIAALDGQILGLDLAPLSEAPIDMLLVPYSETEYGFSQKFIDSITSGDVPSGYKIGLYFVDKDYFDSDLQTIPTIDNYVMAEVVIGGLTNLCVPSEEIPSDGVVEVRMKATNDLNNISFVDKQNLKSFDGSRYGLGNIKEISNNQFESCGKLEEFIIPNSVETVGDLAFNNCFSLSSVTIPESVTEIGAKAFRKCMFLSENFINQSSLDAEANNYWKANVYDVIQEDGLCIRGTSVWGCRPNSSGVTIPDYITRIEENAFIGCTNLKRVDMPNSIKYIGKNAFRYCINVENIVIPESVEEIASDAFTYCFFDLDIFENKSNINAKDNNYWQAVICKDGCVSSCDVLLYVSGENIVIHDGVKEINADAVRNRESIKSIIIPNSVTSIGSSAFTNCISLSSIEIPSSVTSIGDYAFSDCTSLTSVTIPSSVIRIGTSAFDCCYFQRDNFIYNGLCDAEFNNWWGATLYDTIQEDGLCISGTTAITCRPNAKNVTIPSGVTTIGDYAFNNCSGLTSIFIPDSVTSIGSYAFSYCTSLTSVTISDSVTNIGSNTFSGCSSLTSLTIPSSVTSIGQYAFLGCYFQSDEFINNSNLTSSNNWSATLYDIVQEDGLCINGATVVNCRPNATNVTIPNSVTSIGSNGFSGCYNLTSIVIPDGVTSIKNYAFYNCTSLTSITIPNSVTSISSNAFSGCYFQSDKFINNSSALGYPWSATLYDVIQEDGLCISGTTAVKCRPNATNIIIPNSVTSIGEYAFSGRTSLTSVIIQDGVTSIGNRAFSGCTTLTSVTIPSSVTSISHYAFSNCSGLTSVIIPDGVTSIGGGAFYYCTSLTSIVIPDSVTYIDSNAFSDTPFNNNLPNGEIYLGSCYYYYKGTMPSNTSITIKDGTKSICKYAFYNCSGLTSIIIPDSVTSIGEYAFDGCTSLNGDIAQNGFEYFGKILYRDVKPNIDNGITSIRYGCVSLSQSCLSGNNYFSMIIIPDTVTSIGSSAFTNCTSLTTVIIPDSVTSIGQAAFENCTSLTYAEIGDGVTRIPHFTFRKCTSLDKVVIGGGVRSIGDGAFSGCTQLDEVCIKEGLESIEYCAFRDSQLGSITLPSTIKSLDSTCFYNCGFLHEIRCHSTIAPTVNDSFSGLPTNGTLYVPHGSDYTSWKSILPSGWVIKYLYEPKECTNLVITANDVNGRKTKAQISYTATTNGINPITHEVMNDVIVTGVTKSQSFEQNTSYTDTIEREITFEYLGVTASTTITQGVWVEVSYSVDLQDQWRLSSAVPNPDSSLYDGVYESFSNYNVNSSSATCVITINGYSDFKFYIRSNGEKNNDYVDVYDLDGSSTIKATTKSIANSGITLSSYTLVEFTNLDGGEHTIKVVYKKDSSSSSGTDRGYLMIPYNQDE